MRGPLADPWNEVGPAEEEYGVPKRWKSATVIALSVLFIVLLVIALVALANGVGGLVEFLESEDS